MSSNNQKAGQSGKHGQGQDDRGQKNNQFGSRSSSSSQSSPDDEDSDEKDSDTDGRGLTAKDPKKEREVATNAGNATHKPFKGQELDSDEARESSRKSGDKYSKNDSRSSPTNR